MGKKIKFLFGLLLCTGLTAIIIGGGVFFARRVTAQAEKRIKAVETVPMTSFIELDDTSDIVLCAHRGLSAVMPENTLQAIEKAAQVGFKRVEFDIRETADGQLVLMHDDKIDRMTDGSGRVSSYTVTELSRFTVDNGANILEIEEKVRIPTLKETLELCKESGITPVIEIKRMKDKGLRMLKKQLDDFSQPAIVISCSEELLRRYKEFDSDTELWLMTETLDAKTFRIADETGFTLSFKASAVENISEIIPIALEKGYSLAAWTVDDREDFVVLVNLGVKNIITNRILPGVQKN
ncbi:MAG: hypothetical protein IJB86_00535 [Clostridia bacterium]|nr:hypothetical protein [Clostridia bacterium]